VRKERFVIGVTASRYSAKRLTPLKHLPKLSPHHEITEWTVVSVVKLIQELFADTIEALF
jgi:hypothetical protein